MTSAAPTIHQGRPHGGTNDGGRRGRILHRGCIGWRLRGGVVGYQLVVEVGEQLVVYELFRRRLVDERTVIGRIGNHVVDDRFVDRGCVHRRFVNFTANPRQLLAQGRQLVVAELDQRPIHRHVDLEFGDTTLDLFLAAQRRLVQRVGAGADADADRILVGRHQSQVRAAVLDGRRRGCDTAVPGRVLPPHLTQRVAAVDLEDLVGARDTQRRAFAQEVDIAAEGVPVGFVDCEHRLIHAQACVRANALGNPPQGIVACDDIVAARRGIEYRVVSRPCVYRR